ncbi:molybdopterin-guanine dinucleotide biosynthesis protein B [Paenibacillus abyssi]|uniref:Molybdopterin-guanine dinucleotide biosynthesis protein B (MobB) domain-containing protein n=1 Tax=Paenibacillus abyssi TaxID=1340531 RepID=A0A917G3S7_9BACL|nr:molybdopterin-guanine dinucleotide biosynthesis protein B [Paenibacillus abyssi]GGG21197.1 hypothetical protein GCM10010916_42420 [Paenibacillus abyssi]
MNTPFILQIAGYKNTGKTTLLCRLIERFKADGCTVAVIKHDGHDFQMDHPGTDTWKHQAAGADTVAITSPHRTAMLLHRPLSLQELLLQMNDYDVVLVEGFKSENYPKVIMIKEPAHFGLLTSLSQPIAAVVWPDTQEESAKLQQHGELEKPVSFFGLNDADSLYRWLADNAELISGRKRNAP